MRGVSLSHSGKLSALHLEPTILRNVFSGSVKCVMKRITCRSTLCAKLGSITWSTGTVPSSVTLQRRSWTNLSPTRQVLNQTVDRLQIWEEWECQFNPAISRDRLDTSNPQALIFCVSKTATSTIPQIKPPTWSYVRIYVYTAHAHTHTHTHTFHRINPGMDPWHASYEN
jgi:hypothetical protein